MSEPSVAKNAVAELHPTAPIKGLALPSVSLPRVLKLALYSAVPPQPLIAQFDAGFISTPASRAELQSAWERANAAYARLPGPERSYLGAGDLRSLVGVEREEIDRVLQRVRLYPPFDSHPVEIVAVRVSKLVSPQLTVSLPRADRRTSIVSGATDDELFRVSTSPSLTMEPVNRQTLLLAPNQGAHLFTSYDEDVRAHPPIFRDLQLEPRDGDGQVLPSFCLPIGGGIPFIQAHRVRIASGIERVILVNGFHRAFAIARAGYEWLPLVICRLEPVEIPPQFLELPSPLIMNPTSNPPVLTDFLDEDIAMRLEYYPVLRVVRVNWGVDQYAIVLR